MDAIEMLEDDHHEVEELFKQLESDDLSVVPEICEKLTVHTRLEEEVFYPGVRQTGSGTVLDEIDEAVEEHHLVKLLIAELQQMSETHAAYRTYKAKATVLMELVRHHVEEEEQELFPAVRSRVAEDRIEDMGERMMAVRAGARAAG